MYWLWCEALIAADTKALLRLSMNAVQSFGPVKSVNLFSTS